MTPSALLLFAALAVLAAPLLFPALNPFAVWLGCACIAVLAWVWWNADKALGNCENMLRAMEAGDWLAMMNKERVE